MNEVVPLLKHSPSAQDPEVLEEITVQREPLVGTLVEAALDVEGGPRHQLLVGPRGIGKTHILTLVAGRLRADIKDRPILLAWLPEDPWTIRSYEKFLAEILSRVAGELKDRELAAKAKELHSGALAGGLEGEQLLRDALGDIRLVLLVENLDEIFSRIGPEGQARFRAFAEDWRQLLIIATAQQLFEGIQLHESPFYGFFAITHLKELTLDSAGELMRRIAELREDEELAEFLRTDVASRRLAAIEALAGGHPRVWLLLSGCVSIRAIDDLVPLFLEALDDLTPYYQARLRELSEQQQELVVLLSEAGGALSNRELAERSGLAQNQVATLVGQLDDRGYIRRAKVPEEIARGDARMSYWELREPLMRLCLDVKQARGEPLRMVVEFLRSWYGSRLLDELAALPPSAELATTYVGEALRTFDEGFRAEDLFKGTPSEILARAEGGLAFLPDHLTLRLAKATALMLEGRLPEAEREYEQLIANEESKQRKSALRLQMLFSLMAAEKPVDRGDLVELLLAFCRESQDDPRALELAAKGLARLDCHEEAVAALSQAIELEPENVDSYGKRGSSLQELGRHDEALASFERARELDPDNAWIEDQRALPLQSLERMPEALAAVERAIELAPGEARYRERRGELLGDLGNFEAAMEAYDEAIEIDPDRPSAYSNRGVMLAGIGRFDAALESFSRAHEL
jgi:tetratricopeptide (TPR) repeat protein